MVAWPAPRGVAASLKIGNAASFYSMPVQNKMAHFQNLAVNLYRTQCGIIYQIQARLKMSPNVFGDFSNFVK